MNRRDFFKGVAALTAAAALPKPVLAESLPEIVPSGAMTVSLPPAPRGTLVAFSFRRGAGDDRHGEESKPFNVPVTPGQTYQIVVGRPR